MIAMFCSGGKTLQKEDLSKERGSRKKKNVRHRLKSVADFHWQPLAHVTEGDNYRNGSRKAEKRWGAGYSEVEKPSPHMSHPECYRVEKITRVRFKGKERISKKKGKERKTRTQGLPRLKKGVIPTLRKTFLGPDGAAGRKH